jgi:hypothetical protein
LAIQFWIDLAVENNFIEILRRARQQTIFQNCHAESAVTKIVFQGHKPQTGLLFAIVVILEIVFGNNGINIYRKLIFL